MRSPRSAFTLTELLAVIGLIGILAGMAFPTIAMVRKGAAKVSAMTAMGQLGLGIGGFTTEHRGVLPGPLLAGTSQNYNMIQGGIGKYIYSYLESPAPPSASGVFETLKNLTDTYRERRGYATNWARSGQFFPSGKRSDTTGAFDPCGYPGLSSPQNILRISHPGDAIFFQDMSAENSTWAGVPETALYGQYLNLYYDNHVGLTKLAYGKMTTFW